MHITLWGRVGISENVGYPPHLDKIERTQHLCLLGFFDLLPQSVCWPHSGRGGTKVPGTDAHVLLMATHGGFHKWGYRQMDGLHDFYMETPIELDDD